MTAPGHATDDEALWFIEEAGLAPMRPLRERWPELAGSRPCSIMPGAIIEHLGGHLPGDDGPVVPVPERWSPGVPLPATVEPEEIPGHPDGLAEPRARDRDSNQNFGPVDGHDPGGQSRPADWLWQSRQRYGDVPAGRYRVAILPRGIAPVTTAKTRGVSFLVGIIGGAYDGFEIRLNFLVDGPSTLTAVIRRDLSVLQRWAQGLDIGRVASPVDLVKQLGMHGEDRDVVIDLGDRRTRHGITELYAAAVEVGGRRDG